jgi:hypothetical protein
MRLIDEVEEPFDALLLRIADGVHGDERPPSMNVLIDGNESLGLRPCRIVPVGGADVDERRAGRYCVAAHAAWPNARHGLKSAMSAAGPQAGSRTT